MVNQKLLSFKLDSDLVAHLDELCDEYGVKRNRMLNLLVRVGVNNMSGKRHMFNILSALSMVEF